MHQPTKIYQPKVEIQKIKKFTQKKNWEREKVNFFWGKIYVELESVYQIYSTMMGIGIVKIERRGRDRERVTLMLKVVKRWKGKERDKRWKNVTVKYKINKKKSKK